MELQNANPTILRVEQLPTRKPADGSVRKKAIWQELDHLLPARSASVRLGHARWGSRFTGGSQPDAGLEDEPIDEQEIYDLISDISDPEHPFSLGQLAVVNLADIQITPPPSEVPFPDPNRLVRVQVDITPTITHCSHATIIGLAVRVRLERTLPPNYRIAVRVRQGSHAQDDQVTKQLSDKERVAAALENDTLAGVLNTMLKGCGDGGGGDAAAAAAAERT